MKIFLITLIFAYLSACSNDTGSNTNSSENSVHKSPVQQNISLATGGKILVSVSKTETLVQSGGMFKSCKMSFDIDNQSGQSINKILVKYSIMANNTGDQTIADAIGEKTLYFKNLNTGSTKSQSKLSGLECNIIQELQVKSYSCYAAKGKCP